MKEWVNHCGRFCHKKSFGLLLIRVGVGLIFLTHGWMKIHSLPMVEGMFMHLGMGSTTGIFIAWLEVIGGAALILGVLTRFFALAFGIEMFVALVVTGAFSGPFQPHELEVLLMLCSVGLAFTGSGHCSLYKRGCGKCGGMMCDGSTCATTSS
jgi:putative oxidoreductase